MNGVDELSTAGAVQAQADDGATVQPSAFLLELSPDWIVLRASENIHHLLGASHVTLIDEPLGRFVHAQALHDLRNLFSRLSGTTGIARAYRIRLTDDPDLVDVAFQLRDGRVLLEAVACAEQHFGEAFGTVGGLMDGLASSRGQALLDGAARRMRALTGYDRVTLFCGSQRAESVRGSFARPASLAQELPAILCDNHADPVRLFPRKSRDSSADAALMHGPARAMADELRVDGVRATMTIPFAGVGKIAGAFRCDSRVSRRPSLELHAAAELFAQLFALRVEIDQLKGGSA